MRRAKAIAIFLVIGGCAFLAYRVWYLLQAPGDHQSPQTIVAQCDQSLWQYVYNPGRLQVLNPCISVTGTVDEVRKEADGDYHVLFRLDQEFETLLSEKNMSRQHGDLVLEPMCQSKITQADAVESCNSYNGPYVEPQVGQRYLVSGAHVYDADHGWNELHPVTSMQPIQ